MANRAEDSTREALMRRRPIVIASVILPLLAAAGALAPDVVSVMIDESELPRDEAMETDESPVLNFEERLPGMPPLPLPREFDTGFRPGTLDLEQLFMRARLGEDSMSARFSRLLSFPRNHGDVIVMDDVDQQIRDIIFKDPIIVGAVTEVPAAPSLDLFPLGDPRPAGDGLQFDDPQVTGLIDDVDPIPSTVLPEPGTFALTMAGLLLLAWRRKRRGYVTDRDDARIRST